MEICGRRWLLLWFLRLLTGFNPSLTKVFPRQILVWNFLRDLIFPSRRLTIALRIMCSVNNVWIRHWGSLEISLSKVACTSWLAFPTNIPNRWLLHQHPVYGYVSFFSISLQQGSFSEPQHRLLIPEALRMELWIQPSYKWLATMSTEYIYMVYLMLYSRFNLHCYQHLFILLLILLEQSRMWHISISPLTSISCTPLISARFEWAASNSPSLCLIYRVTAT